MSSLSVKRLIIDSPGCSLPNLVYSLLSLFVTQSEAYTNIGVAAHVLERAVWQAHALKILARALRYDLGARRLINARAELCRRVVSLMRWFRICSLTRVRHGDVTYVLACAFFGMQSIMMRAYARVLDFFLALLT